MSFSILIVDDGRDRTETVGNILAARSTEATKQALGEQTQAGNDGGFVAAWRAREESNP